MGWTFLLLFIFNCGKRMHMYVFLVRFSEKGYSNSSMVFFDCSQHITVKKRFLLIFLFYYFLRPHDEMGGGVIDNSIVTSSIGYINNAMIELILYFTSHMRITRQIITVWFRVSIWTVVYTNIKTFALPLWQFNFFPEKQNPKDNHQSIFCKLSYSGDVKFQGKLATYTPA